MAKRTGEIFVNFLIDYYKKELSKNVTRKKVSDLYWLLEDFALDGFPGIKKTLIRETNLNEYLLRFKIRKRSLYKISKEEINKFIISIPKKTTKVYLMNDGGKLFFEDKKLSKDKKNIFSIKLSRSHFGHPKNGNGYIKLLDIIYFSIRTDKKQNFSSFYALYLKNFKRMAKRNANILRVSNNLRKEIFYILDKAKDKEHIVFIDTGYTGSFPLLCCSLMDIYKKRSRIEKSIYLYSVYPWLKELYRGKFYTDNYKKVRAIEGV